MIATLYLLTGLLQAFALWLSRDDDQPTTLDELATCLLLWPLLWLDALQDRAGILTSVRANWRRFIKVSLAMYALINIILFIIERTQ